MTPRQSFTDLIFATNTDGIRQAGRFLLVAVPVLSTCLLLGGCSLSRMKACDGQSVDLALSEEMCKQLGDKDGDGLADEIDPRPDTHDGKCFGSSVAWYNNNCKGVLSAKDIGATMPDIQWRSTSNSNAYYFVRFKVKKGPARVNFTFPNNTSWLGDLHLIAREQDVCVVPLLIGTSYSVMSTTDFEFFECCNEKIGKSVKISETGPCTRQIEFPLVMTFKRVK